MKRAKNLSTGMKHKGVCPLIASLLHKEAVFLRKDSLIASCESMPGCLHRHLVPAGTAGQKDTLPEAWGFILLGLSRHFDMQFSVRGISKALGILKEKCKCPNYDCRFFVPLLLVLLTF